MTRPLRKQKPNPAATAMPTALAVATARAEYDRAKAEFDGAKAEYHRASAAMRKAGAAEIDALKALVKAELAEKAARRSSSA